MATTLKDIAAEVGVSVNTVSRVLSGRDDHMIGKRTRERVLDTARRLRYRRNPYARGLSSTQTRLVGLLTSRRIEVHLARAAAIEEQIRARGYRVVPCDASNHPEREAAFVEECAAIRVEGLIAIDPVSMLSPSLLRPLFDEGIPIVSARETDLPGVDWVDADRVAGAYAAVSHLLERGHRRVAYLDLGPASWTSRVTRLPGYQAALRDHGVPAEDEIRISLAPLDGYAAGWEGARRVLALQPRPTALFCQDDRIAIGAMNALHAAGVRIPEEVAVAGFDDIVEAAYAYPPLTTVHQPAAECGREAVDMLFRRLEAARQGVELPPQRHVFEMPLVVRQST